MIKQPLRIRDFKSKLVYTSITYINLKEYET